MSQMAGSLQHLVWTGVATLVIGNPKIKKGRVLNGCHMCFLCWRWIGSMSATLCSLF